MAAPPPRRLSGATGSITTAGGSADDLTDAVHLLPCSIKHTAHCPVSHYFRPRPAPVVDGLSIDEAFFRGRRLQGTAVPIPHGYRGYVLGKRKASGDGEEGFVEWEAKAEFGNLRYWNHGSAPSKEDPVVRGFHWFDIADALHKPITAEELASSTILQQK